MFMPNSMLFLHGTACSKEQYVCNPDHSMWLKICSHRPIRPRGPKAAIRIGLDGELLLVRQLFAHSPTGIDKRQSY